MSKENLGARGGGHVLQRYRLQLPGGAVNDGEDVDVSVC